MLLRREWPLFLLLCAWAILTLGPVILLGNVIYSRYVLAGTLPLLLAAAYLLTHALAWTFSRLPTRAAFPISAVILIGLLAQPFADISRQCTRWWTTTLTAKDRYQYVTGWTAGLATTRTINYLQHLAEQGPIVVITGNEWGTPADALWVYLAGNPNITLYYTDKPRILTPGATGGTMLREAKWLFPPYTEVVLPLRVPIFYVTQRIWGDREADAALAAQNPNLRLQKTIQGLSENFPSLGEKDGDVLLFTQRRPGSNW